MAAPKGAALPELGLNDRRLAVEILRLIDRRLDLAIRGRLTAHRYGVVDGVPDTVHRTVAVRVYGLPNPSPGFHYGSGLAPRDGDHVRVYLDPRGDKWIDDILGRDVVSEIIDVVTPPTVQPDRARGAIARVINAEADFTPATIVQRAQVQSSAGGLFSMSATFGAPVTAGNTLVAIITAYDENLTWDSGLVELTLVNQTIGARPAAVPRVAVATKTADGTETTIGLSWLVGQPLAIFDIYELTPGTLAGAFLLWDTGTPVDFPTVTPAGAEVLLLASISTFQGYGITVAPAGWTAEQETIANNGSNSIRAANYSRPISSPSGSYSGSVSYAAGIASTAIILMFGAEAIDESSSVAPETIDGDDATYHVSTLAEAIRFDLRTAYRIVRARIVIGCATAGAKSYELRGATQGDYSDEVTLTAMGFTAAGAYAPAVVTPVWPSTTPHRFYRIVGPAESRRVFTVELYETTAGETPVTDPTSGLGAEIDAALAAILAAVITDHGGLTGLGDDDHPQYSTAAELSAYAQPLDSDLTAFAALAIAADTLPYGTGSHTLGLTGLSAFIRTLLDDSDAATARATLGVSAVGALDDLSDVAITGPADGEILRRVSGTWVNTAVPQPLVEDDGAGSFAFVFETNGEVIWE